MKIIHCVEAYNPAVNGMQTVVCQLSERLVELGHEVTVLTSKDTNRKERTIKGVKVVDFSIKGNQVNGFYGEIENFQRYIQSEPCDIFVNFAAQQWSSDLTFPVLNKIPAKKVFVPTGFSGFYDPKYKKYYEMMEGWIKMYDANIFLSHDYRDINFARKHQANNIVVIPNGANEREFAKPIDHVKVKGKYSKSTEGFIVLTVGSHTSLKGHNECMKVFRKAKLRNSSLIIVGNTPCFTLKFTLKAIIKTSLSFLFHRIKPDCTINCKLKSFLFNWNPVNFFRKSKILVVNLSREETVELFKASDVFLFASNIECSPIVLFECCAVSLPFLVADVGNSAEILSWTSCGEMLETKKDRLGFSHIHIDKSALQLKKIYNQPEYRNQLGKNGYNAFCAKYNWNTIASKYEALYYSLLNN